jgi:hypothetical protein
MRLRGVATGQGRAGRAGQAGQGSRTERQDSCCERKEMAGRVTHPLVLLHKILKIINPVLCCAVLSVTKEQADNLFVQVG